MTEQETSYLLQTCGEGLVVREFITSAQYDMLAYKKPVYHCWEQRRFIYDEHTPAGTEYYMGITREPMNTDGSVAYWKNIGPYSWGRKEEIMLRGRIYKKSLHGMKK